MFAQVSFPFSSFNTFTYSIPESLIKDISLGVCVNAPIKNKLHSGFIIQIKNKPSFAGKILPIHSIKNKSFHLPNELWKTINWLSKYYVVPLGQVLKAAIPATILTNFSPQYIKYAVITQDGKNELMLPNKKKPAQIKILNALSIKTEPIK